ncbi:hypothetical protein CROQUDRAFT_92652 [Cronartium quercuum f. sp. fusiforme G11]|uniref:Uncharacterized protein n=1 Tax=Cronartium quercuum f. sp. fusiforme G11 TaxID=708437 RepID=A0A9P6NLU8_9BASI|nr:hypothetical protein CROQUDRAFT_92652 [Cronartium quercuum f. sp. fusiforme G11]
MKLELTSTLNTLNFLRNRISKVTVHTPFTACSTHLAFFTLAFTIDQVMNSFSTINIPT